MLAKTGNITEVNSPVTLRSKWNTPSEWSNSWFSCFYLVLDCLNTDITPGEQAGAIPLCLSKMQTRTEGVGWFLHSSFFAVREGGTTLETGLRYQSLSYELNEPLTAHKNAITVLCRGHGLWSSSIGPGGCIATWINNRAVCFPHWTATATNTCFGNSSNRDRSFLLLVGFQCQ